MYRNTDEIEKLKKIKADSDQEMVGAMKQLKEMVGAMKPGGKRRRTALAGGKTS